VTHRKSHMKLLETITEVSSILSSSWTDHPSLDDMTHFHLTSSSVKSKPIRKYLFLLVVNFYGF